MRRGSRRRPGAPAGRITGPTAAASRAGAAAVLALLAVVAAALPAVASAGTTPAAAVGALPVAGGVPVAQAGSAQAGQGAELTVMARNLYLGADVGIALELLPDMPAAAQFMWEQVAATDFDVRAASLAAEAARHRPDVIGLQEATRWWCRPGDLGRGQDVFDFTATFLEATRAAGVPYVIAEAGGERALQPGYAIPPLPFLSRVVDPDTFQPLFGRDTATCGFEIGDALLVRADLADRVVAVGRSWFEDRYAVVPLVMVIDRGYAWADLALEGATVRVVTTHLESLWDEGEVPDSARQAAQLVEDLAATTLPLVVIGDLNADPRDPRGPGDPNPALQPTASEACPAQVDRPTVGSALGACNAYWLLRQAGFDDAGPDPTDPLHLTWGTSALLAGPDPLRVDDALAMGNPAGFTDRLDYVLVRGGIEVVDAELIGSTWPDGPDLWACDHPDQVANTEAMSVRLAEAGFGEPVVGEGRCLPTDHAGVVATLRLPPTEPGATSPPPPVHAPSPFGLWTLAIFLLALVAALRLARRIRGRDRVAPPLPEDQAAGGGGGRGW